MSRRANDECRLCAIDSHTPPRRLLAIATSTDGILNESISLLVGRGKYVCGRPERKGLGRCRGKSKEWTVGQNVDSNKRQTNERVINLGDEKRWRSSHPSLTR